MTLDFSKTPLMMGILNVTPDSFSGDGLMTGDDYVNKALDLAARMVGEGADWMDIGGESSRPGHTPVSVEEEIRRTAPVIAELKKKFPSIPLAIDTVKAKVAEAALDAGATIINDISALQRDPAMAALVAKTGAHLVLMDNRSNPAGATQDPKLGGEYPGTIEGDIAEHVLRHLMERAAFAQQVGIAKEKIILDPGIGFGKTVEQNMALIRHIGLLRSLGHPVLVGPSRKSFIGRVLDLAVDERLEGTAALVAIAAFQNADIIRVHDMQFMARAARMAAAVRRSA